MAGKKRKPPGGYRSKTGFRAPTGLTSESALEDIKEILKVADEHITSDEVSLKYKLDYPFDTRIYTHVNKDGTVDGELRIENIPEDLPISEALVVLTEGNPFKTFKGLWSSIGIRFAEVAMEDMKERYKRHRGLYQESTYYGRSSVEMLNQQRATAQLISENMEKYGFPKAEQIYVRFHWNKQNTKPGARYSRRPKTS